MLKVWRAKATIFAECTSCGSYGTANHLQPTQKLDPDIEEAVEKHTAHMMALRSHFEKAARVIATQVKDGSISRKEGSDKVREMYNNHVAQIRLAEAGLPDPTGKIKEVVVACPWCKAPSPEIEIETLPDDTSEPPFSLARPPMPRSISSSKGK